MKLASVLCLLLLYVGCSTDTPEPSSTGVSVDKYYTNRFLRELFEDSADDFAPAEVGEREKSALLSRGSYLVNGPAACGSCHSLDSIPGQPLSGGKVLQDSFGAVNSANITPSVNYGIGTWSVAEIMQAIRSGVGKDSRPLSLDLHATYRWMSDVDAKAIAFYLKSQQPKEVEVERRELGTFDVKRLGLFPRHRAVEGYVPSPPRSSAAPYGRYLAYSVAGCYGCHTPRGGFGSDEIPFSGGLPNKPGIVSSLGSLFSILTPTESTKQDKDSLSLLSAEAQSSIESDTGAEQDFQGGPGAQPSSRFDSASEAGQYPFAGPDIRGQSETGLLGWAKSDLIKYLETGTNKKGDQKDPRACPWPFFKNMNSNDKDALAAFFLNSK